MPKTIKVVRSDQNLRRRILALEKRVQGEILKCTPKLYYRTGQRAPREIKQLGNDALNISKVLPPAPPLQGLSVPSKYLCALATYKPLTPYNL